MHDNDRAARARQRLPRPHLSCPRRPLRPHRARDRDARARRDRPAHRRRQLPPARARHLAARPPRERARPDRPPRRRRRPLPARPRRGARLARLDLRRPRDHVRRPERVLALPGRGVGRPLHDRAAGDPRRHRPDGHRPRRPVAFAALLRIPNAHLPPPGSDARRFGGTGIRDLLAGRLPGRLRLHLHAHGTRRRPARPPRPVRARHRHDERLGRADGLVRPLQEPRRGDPLPRRDPLRRGPDADPARLRRPAPEPARSGHERRRHRPLGGRPRPASPAPSTSRRAPTWTTTGSAGSASPSAARS